MAGTGWHKEWTGKSGRPASRRRVARWLPRAGSAARRKFISRIERGICFTALVTALSVAAYLGFSRLCVSRVEIVGSSMYPTLQAGDSYLVERILSPGNFQRGQIVVCRLRGDRDLIVKRIVGLPFETVQFTNNAVYVRGQPLREPYLPCNMPTVVPGKEPTFRLQKDEYVVLGDNRAASDDSRSFGIVRKKEIVGLLIRYD